MCIRDRLGRVVAAGTPQRRDPDPPPEAEPPAPRAAGDDDVASGEILTELAHLAELVGPAVVAVTGHQSAAIAHHTQGLRAALDAHRRAHHLDSE